tara:strand:+ start:13076 stop:14179 length:1104 start_codon:yes stop_codon:yes gene_type:complete
MNKDIENVLGEAGFTLSDAPPTEEPQQEQPQVESKPEAEPQPEPQAQAAQEAPQETPVEQNTEQQVESKTQQQEEVNANDIDVASEVLSFLSEKLGRKFDSYDSLSEALNYTPVEIDERVSAINKFVLETGRSPEDWYRYQSLDPSEMDDMAVVRLQMSSKHSNLDPNEVNLLLGNKYKLDSDLYTEDEVKLAKLQLKMDADGARQYIGDLRDSYMAPTEKASEDDTLITEEWISEMSKSTNTFGSLDFDIPGKSEMFKFGINDGYKKELIQKNSNLENYFDDYINESGSWDFDKLNAHRALVDNIDSIVSSIYNQGLSDGKMGVVQTAANVDASRPAVGSEQGSDSKISEQLLKALGGSDVMTFNP